MQVWLIAGLELLSRLRRSSHFGRDLTMTPFVDDGTENDGGGEECRGQCLLGSVRNGPARPAQAGTATCTVWARSRSGLRFYFVYVSVVVNMNIGTGM